MFSSTFQSSILAALALTSQLQLTQATTEHNGVGEIAFQDVSGHKNINKMQLQDVHAREVAHVRILKDRLQQQEQGQQRQQRKH
eukprot:Awhi_evm1s979